MSFTFATLKTAIQDYTETSETTFNNIFLYLLKKLKKEYSRT